MTPTHADLCRRLDGHGNGDALPDETVVVWLWRPPTGPMDAGYWAPALRVSGRWYHPGGTPIHWTPTWWQPIPEPDGPPPEPAS